MLMFNGVWAIHGEEMLVFYSYFILLIVNNALENSLISWSHFSFYLLANLKFKEKC